MVTFPITVINDPANISDPDVFQASGLLLDWLIDQYGTDGFSVPTSIYIGSISELSEIDARDYHQLNREIDAPIFIVHQPLGELAVQLIIALVVAVAVTVLMPTPDITPIEGAGRQKRSPNNSLSGQQNIARTLERVPEIFGKVKSYPDLIAPTVQEFIGHVKFQTEYMCIGRGYYTTEEIKSGETLVSDIPGSIVDLYDPGSAPTTILKTSVSNSVSSQVITDVGSGTVLYMPLGSIVTYNIGPDTAAVSSGFNTSSTLPSAFQPGSIITLTEVFVDIAATEYNLDGNYEILSAVNSEFGWTMVIIDVAVENANWLNVGTADPVLFIAGAVPVTPSISSADGSSGPFTVPGENLYQVWMDVQAPKGLADGAALDEVFSVTVEFFFEQIDSVGVPTGSNFTHAVIFTDSTIEARFWTVKVGTADGLLVGTRYRVSVTRTTVYDPTTTVPTDEMRWTRLAGIEDISGPDTSGTTRISVQTQATEQVAALQDRKFNMHSTRHTVYWDGASVIGNISTGVGLLPSRRFADAFLHYMLDPELAAQAEANIDILALYAIQDERDTIGSGETGEFNFTFDGKNTPALEEIRQIAQAARCFAFRQGSIFSATRDQAQTVSRGLFNRRNKLPDSEIKSIKFNRPLDKDGIVIEYNDIDTDKAVTIKYPDDLDPGDEHFGLPNTINPLKVDGVGIRQALQAEDRAQYEFRKLIYGRTSVETSVTAEGILLPLNARIDCVDNTRLVSEISDGEVKAKSGLIVDTSERCIFVSGTYSVIFRDEEGEPSTPIVVTERLDTEFGFILDSDYPVIVRGDSDYQRGTLYSFGPDGNEFINSYLVQRKIPDGVGNVKLELINYSEKYYEADTLPDTGPDDTWEWVQTGNGLAITGASGIVAVAALSQYVAAYFDTGNDELRTYSFDGSDFTQVGSGLSIPEGYVSMAALSSTRIALSKGVNTNFAAYDWNGSVWSQTGNNFAYGGLASADICGMSANRIGFFDSGNDELRAYDFDGVNWALVGNGLSIAGASGNSALVALDSSTIVRVDQNNDTIATYSFDGSDWSLVGSISALVGSVGISSVAMLTTTTVVVIDSNSKTFENYLFDGSTWSNTDQPSTPVANVGAVSIDAFNGTEIAYMDNANDELRFYTLTAP